MDHFERVDSALCFIEAHLTEELDVAAVAAHANSSLYWFHRVFTAVVDDSLGEYIRKRRLNRAAEELIGTDRRILDIALDFGFSSQEAFTRSFRDHFSITPARYRKAGLLVIRRTPVSIEQLRREHKPRGRGPMQTGNTTREGIRIIELPPVEMATSKGHSLDEFNKWWSKIDKTRSDKFYPRDFMYYDVELKQSIWQYVLPEFIIETGEYEKINFPGGLYAVAVSINGNDINGEQVYTSINEWINQTDYFSNDEGSDRQTMFHVITSDLAYSAMKYRQLDIYVPITVTQP